MIGNDVTSFLMGGGVPSAKFAAIGDTVRGRVVSAEVQDQKDLDGNVRVWDDGNPRKQLKIVLATDLRDPEITDDNGDRALYVKGQMAAAVREAVKAAGAGSLDAGGELAVRYDRDEPNQKRGYNPTKIYRAQYKAPAVNVDDMFDTGNPAAAEPVAAAPAPAAPSAGVSEDDLL